MATFVPDTMWHNLTGGVETLDDTHLMRLAGRFSRRVRGWAKANAVPVIDCRAGERKHDLAEEYLKTTPITRGVFLILVRKAQAPVWEVSVSGPGRRITCRCAPCGRIRRQRPVVRGLSVIQSA